MRVKSFLLWGALGLLATACTTSHSAAPTAAAPAKPVTLQQPTIVVLSHTPVAGSPLTAASTIKAKLAYALPANDTAKYGYSLFIQFATTQPNGLTIGAPNASRNPDLPPGSGTLDIDTPLDRVWTNPVIKHPITCYYYLAKRTSASRSTVVARTAPITFTE